MHGIVLAFLRSAVRARAQRSGARDRNRLSIILEVRPGDTGEFYHGPNVLGARVDSVP